MAAPNVFLKQTAFSKLLYPNRPDRQHPQADKSGAQNEKTVLLPNSWSEAWTFFTLGEPTLIPDHGPQGTIWGAAPGPGIYRMLANGR